MTQANFGSILDRPSTDVEKPKPLPVGTYVCVVRGLPKMDKSTKKQTEYAEFTLQPLQARDDVDADDLEAALTSPTGGKKQLSATTIRATYYLTEDAIWRLKKFLDDCGVEEGDKSLRQRLGETPGCQVLAHIKHQASDDGLSVYAQLAGTAPVE